MRLYHFYFLCIVAPATGLLLAVNCAKKAFIVGLNLQLKHIWFMREYDDNIMPVNSDLAVFHLLTSNEVLRGED